MVSQKDFEALLGRPVPPNAEPGKGSYTLNTPIGEMQGSLIGRQLFNMLNKNISEMIKGQEDTPTGMMMANMVQEMPLRSMLMMGGPFNRDKLDALLTMINGRFFKGLFAFIRANKAQSKK